MARKNSIDYFETFVELAGYSCQAANLLNETMMDFNPDELQDKMKEMHDIEHAADEVRHTMIKRLAREFITPIEREDIMALADSIDNVVDTIEDVLRRMYMCNIIYVRKHALKMTAVIIKCCDTLKQALDEFRNFRKSKILHDLIVQINNLEEEGDKLFTEAIRELYVNCKSPVEVTAWDRTFHYLENCYDTCEDAANLIENIVLKNS